MGNRNSLSDSDCLNSFKPVWLDTNLDTGIVLTVSDTDTVFHLKEKIEKEHPMCFPNMGGIKVHALKVQGKGIFYHLPDSILLKMVFDGFEKCWSLKVEASRSGDRDPDFGSQFVLCDNTRNDLPCGSDLVQESQRKRLSNMNDSSEMLGASKQHVEGTAPINSCGRLQKFESIEVNECGEISHKISCGDVYSVAMARPAGEEKRDPPGEEHRVPNSTVVCVGEDDAVKVTIDGKCKISQEGTTEALATPSRKCKRRMVLAQEIDGADGTCLNQSSHTTNTLEGNISQFEHAKKRRHRTEKISGNKESLTVNDVCVSDSRKEQVMILHLGDTQKAHAAVDGFSTEPLYAAHSLEISSSSGKRRGKKKSFEHGAQAEDTGEGNRMFAAGISKQIACGESVEAPISIQNMLDLPHAKVPSELIEGNHGDSVLEMKDSSVPSFADATEDNVGNMDGTAETYEKEATMGVNGGTDLKGHPSLVNDSFDCAKQDVGLSGHEYITRNDHLACRSQIGWISVEKDSLQDNDTSDMLSAKSNSTKDMDSKRAAKNSELVDPKEIADTAKASKRKRREDPKDSVGGKVIKDSKASGLHLSSAEMHKTVERSQCRDQAEISEGGKTQVRKVARYSILVCDTNEVEFGGQTNNLCISGEKSRKKSKKKRLSTEEKQADWQENVPAVKGDPKVDPCKTVYAEEVGNLVEASLEGSKIISDECVRPSKLQHEDASCDVDKLIR